MFNFWKFRNNKNIPRCVLLGADYTGKTTLLYMWHLGAVVKTIATIGFNFETIHHDGRSLDIVDFGGCGNIAPLAAHYLDSTTGILFMHALNSDPERTKESLELLRLHAGQVEWKGGKYVWVMITKQDLVPVEEQATKRHEVYHAMKDILQSFGSAIEWKVFDDPGLNSYELDRLWPIFDDMAKVLNEQGTVTKAPPIAVKYSEEQLREKIIREAADDVSTDEFWNEFLKAELPVWNHRNHLRAGYLMLLKSASMLEDFWTAVETFLDHIARLRNTRPDRFRNTAHRTMTMFWLYVLKLSILKFRNTQSRLPKETEFQEVLLVNPRLADTSYWEEYYTRSSMFTPEAKQNWCLPDKKPLPTNIQDRSTHESSAAQPPKKLPKASKSVRKDDKAPDGQIRFLRFAISVVQEYLISGQRRGMIVASRLAKLQKTTMQQRASDPSIAPYSETQAYFWIQIVHATLLPYHQRDQSANPQSYHNKLQNVTRNSNSVKSLTFSEFLHIFPLKSTLWTQYYSETVWTSVASRMSFVNPDLRPLPNVFPTAPSSIIAERFMEAKMNQESIDLGSQYAATGSDLDNIEKLTRSREELDMQLDSILTEIASTTGNEDTVTGTIHLISNDKEQSRTISPHALLLYNLYNSWRLSMNSTNREVDISKFVSLVLSGGAKQMNRTGNPEGAPTDGHNQPNIASKLNRLELGTDKTDRIADIGMTKLLFYSRAVLALSTQTMSQAVKVPDAHDSHLAKSKPGSAGVKTEFSIDGFRNFLAERSSLIWEDFPLNYYTSETWNSLDAKVMMIAPDLRPLPEYNALNSMQNSMS